MGLLKKFEGFTIWSENYKELAEWYKETFELKMVMELDQPEDMAIAFEIEPGNEMYLWIGYHSEVHGKSNDTYRLMISFIVDDVNETYNLLKARGVEFIALPHQSPAGDINVLTIKDPENNMVQLFSINK